MPIRTRPSTVDSVTVARMVWWLQGRRPGDQGHRARTLSTGTATATIGTGSGHAARGQVAHQGGRHVLEPGPGFGVGADPMERWQRALSETGSSPAPVWGGICGCAHC